MLFLFIVAESTLSKHFFLIISICGLTENGLDETNKKLSLHLKFLLLKFIVFSQLMIENDWECDFI